MSLGGTVTISWSVLLAHKWPAAHLRIQFYVVLLGTATAMLRAAP